MNKKIVIIILIFLLGLIFSYSKVLATIPAVSRFVSERQSVSIAFEYEDVFPRSVLLAELQQNIDALDSVFNQLHQAGKLNEKYSILSIEAHMYLSLEDPESRFYVPTALSTKQNVL